MGTPASLLDVIAKGGSLPGYNEAQQAQANIAHTQAQVPLIQAQTQETQARVPFEQSQAARNQLETQILQNQLKDADIQRQIFTDIGAGKVDRKVITDPRMFLGEMAKRGATGMGAMKAAGDIASMNQNALKLGGEQLDYERNLSDRVGQLLQNLKGLPPDQRTAMYQQEMPALQKLDPSVRWEAFNPNDDQQLNAHIGAAMTHSALLGQQKTEAETKNIGSETAKNTAQAGLATAETPGAQAESERKQLITKAMKDAQNAQQSGVHPVDSVLPPTIDAAQNRSYKAAYNAVMANAGPEAANHVLESAAGYAADVAKANNPQIRAGEVAKSVATEAALTPLRIHQQVQAEVEKARLAPDSFNAIVDPRARQEAMSQYQKDSTEFADKVGQAQQLKDFVAAAQSGNKAAPGLIPITEVRGVVNRVNRQELESVSSAAGSAWDHVQGFFNKWTEGQPIPPEVLKDTAEIASTMQKSAERTYHMKVEVNNKTHGGNVKPISFTQETHSAIPEITSQADYDKLPKGSQYTHNGEVLTKR